VFEKMSCKLAGKVWPDQSHFLQPAPPSGNPIQASFHLTAIFKNFSSARKKLRVCKAVIE
jgi:hypothetical protein